MAAGEIAMGYSLTEGQLNDPADAGIVDGLAARLEVSLPQEYADFLKEHNGGEGFIGDNYIIFWKAEELAVFNTEYEVEQYAPGILLFASSGGGEGYGFDTEAAAMPIVRVPFVGMAREYAEPVAGGFPDFFRKAGASVMSNRVIEKPQGMELVEIMPIIVGGDPSDPQNKTMVTRQQHFEMVRYWNRIISDLRKGNAT